MKRPSSGNLIEKMKRLADLGHPNAEALLEAANAFEKASTEFLADQRTTDGISIYREKFLTTWQDACRVHLESVTPPKDSVATSLDPELYNVHR